MTDFTVVLGVDRHTLPMLAAVWPTWEKHKPSLMERRWVIFYDGVSTLDIDRIVKLPRSSLVEWPPYGVTYPRSGETKWSNPQRAKMLAGFVHVPAAHVSTDDYWLKLDVDVVATGDDDWVDPAWFEGNPSIVAPGWGYTKPPYQMRHLDEWAAANPKIPEFIGTEPLRLEPEQGSDLVRHPRIASWCSFFGRDFTRLAARAAAATVGRGQLPVDSQDGYLWYFATRAGFGIRKVNFRRHGWAVKAGFGAVRNAAADALGITEGAT